MDRISLIKFTRDDSIDVVCGQHINGVKSSVGEGNGESHHPFSPSPSLGIGALVIKTYFNLRSVLNGLRRSIS